jgi:hypothetical protein
MRVKMSATVAWVLVPSAPIVAGSTTGAAVNVHSGSMMFAKSKPKLIILPSGGVASIGVAWSDNPVGSQKCLLASYAVVALPNGIGRLDGALGLANTEPCGGKLIVTPLEAGAVPAPNNG